MLSKCQSLTAEGSTIDVDGNCWRHDGGITTLQSQSYECGEGLVIASGVYTYRGNKRKRPDGVVLQECK